ncbi:MAG: hypothetical protein JST54_05350 [Deltaproteobacteria bacterium]|nr:hypothetical protein [Deltaproteobacteria bacterium]
MRLPTLLLTTVLLGACASSNSDAPRATMDPDHENAHYAPGLGEPDPLAKPTAIDPTEKKKAQAKPCGGNCGPGEYCDTSSGIERCQKDVMPAATPGK